MEDNECLKQILLLQKHVFDAKEELRGEIAKLKDSVEGRISPIETEIAQNKHTMGVITKVLTWALPSGFLVGISAWIEKFWK